MLQGLHLSRDLPLRMPVSGKDEPYHVIPNIQVRVFRSRRCLSPVCGAVLNAKETDCRFCHVDREQLLPVRRRPVPRKVRNVQRKAEVTIPIKGNILRAEQATTDMYTSIELAGDTIEKQLLKHRKKLIEKHHNVEGFSEVYLEEDAEDEDEILIVRKKSFAVKPMDPEEACLQMDMLGHNFYVFRNADTDEICVVYKRKNNTYGLIEPEA